MFPVALPRARPAISFRSGRAASEKCLWISHASSLERSTFNSQPSTFKSYGGLSERTSTKRRSRRRDRYDRARPKDGRGRAGDERTRALGRFRATIARITRALQRLRFFFARWRICGVGSETGAKTRSDRGPLRASAGCARYRFVRQHSRPTRPPGDQSESGRQRARVVAAGVLTGRNSPRSAARDGGSYNSIFQKRSDRRRRKLFSAVQEFQLDQEYRFYQLTAHFFDQRRRRSRGPAGRKQVVDQNDLFAARNGIDVQFHFRFAVLEGIFRALGFVGQPAFFSQRHKTDAELVVHS